MTSLTVVDGWRCGKRWYSAAFQGVAAGRRGRGSSSLGGRWLR